MTEPTTVTRLPVRARRPTTSSSATRAWPRCRALLGTALRSGSRCASPSRWRVSAERVIARLGDHEVLRLPLPDGEVAKTGQVAIEAWERARRGRIHPLGLRW